MIHKILGPHLSRILQRRFFSAAKLRWKLSSGVQIEILSPVDWCLYNDIFVEGEYDLAIQEAFSGINDKREIKVLDLGANVGFFILRLMDLARRNQYGQAIKAIAVEPESGNIAELKRRVCSQNFEPLNLQIIEGVVGQREGRAILYNSHNYHAHTIVSKSQYSGSKPQEVSFVNLETLFPDERWDLVKCDIEGAEGAFAENYLELLKRTRVAVFEFHHGACDAERIRSLLVEAGLIFERVIVHHGSNSMHLFCRSKIAQPAECSKNS